MRGEGERVGGGGRGGGEGEGRGEVAGGKVEWGLGGGVG